MFCSRCSLSYFARTLVTKNISKIIFFSKSNKPEKRYRIFKNKCQIDELSEDNNEIFQCNMLDRYPDRKL